MSIKELIQEEVAEILEAAKNPLPFQLVVEALELRQITVRTMNPRKFSEHYFQGSRISWNDGYLGLED